MRARAKLSILDIVHKTFRSLERVKYFSENFRKISTHLIFKTPSNGFFCHKLFSECIDVKLISPQTDFVSLVSFHAPPDQKIRNECKNIQKPPPEVFYKKKCF